MKKVEGIEFYQRLNKQQKGELTLAWLADLIKTNKLTIIDVMDIINAVDTTFTKLDKFNSMIITENVSASTISRLFGYGYAKSMRIINILLKENAIVKIENSYKIIDKEKFKAVGISLFEEKANGKI